MNIKFLKLYPNCSKIIDLNVLQESYNSGLLKDADIFALLFKIIENPNYAPSDEEDINLSVLHIREYQWDLLYGFIINGYLPFHVDNHRNIDNLNLCYEVALKLGGIPSFDKYYKDNMDFYKEEIEKLYNPMTPKEDIKQKYNWRTINVLDRNIVYLDDEDVTKTIFESSPTHVLFYRKIKHTDEVPDEVSEE